MATFIKLSVFYILIFSNLSIVLSTEIKVKGPHEVFIGDYEKFTCEIKGEDVNSNYGMEWKFKLKNGDTVSMNDTIDMLSALEVRKYEEGHLTVITFIRADKADISSVICQHSPKLLNSLDIEVKDLTAITADDDPCTEAEKMGKPVTSVFIPSIDQSSPSYRRSHFIGNQYVSLAYGNDVTEVKLVCYSPSHLSPVWSLKKEKASKMKFAVWAQDYPHSCKQQVFHIYQVAGEPGIATNFSLDCITGALTSKVNLGFQFPFTRGGGIDMNSTENCVNEIVDKFYNKELTGVGIGSSFVIVLMMAGIAVLKRQLNQQQNINKDLTTKNPVENAANSNGASSTERLNGNQNPNFP